jgi:hypothetical protein
VVVTAGTDSPGYGYVVVSLLYAECGKEAADETAVLLLRVLLPAHCLQRLSLTSACVRTIHSTSPTGLKGDASPFARRNDIIRNSLSSLTASLDLTRPAVGGAANRKLSSATACDR